MLNAIPSPRPYLMRPILTATSHAQVLHSAGNNISPTAYPSWNNALVNCGLVQELYFLVWFEGCIQIASSKASGGLSFCKVLILIPYCKVFPFSRVQEATCDVCTCGPPAKALSHSLHSLHSVTTCDVFTCEEAARAFSNLFRTPHSVTICDLWTCGQVGNALSHSLHTPHIVTTCAICTCGQSVKALSH